MFKKIVAIISGRKSATHIKDLMEKTYAIENYSIEEMLQYAKSGKALCPAEYYKLPSEKNQGMNYTGIIFCGNNPFIMAFKATNIVSYTDNDNLRKLKWKQKDMEKMRRIIQIRHSNEGNTDLINEKDIWQDKEIYL